MAHDIENVNVAMVRLAGRSRESLRLVLAVHFDITNDIRGGFGVPGIENSAHFFIIFHETVSLIDEKCRADFFDVAKQCAAASMRKFSGSL